MKVSRPTIYNVTLTNANTEYSQQLNSSIENFMLQCRTLADIKFSFVSGQSGTTFITIPAGSSYVFNFGWTGTRTIYFQSPSAGVVAEILAWD